MPKTSPPVHPLLNTDQLSSSFCRKQAPKHAVSTLTLHSGCGALQGCAGVAFRPGKLSVNQLTSGWGDYCVQRQHGQAPCVWRQY